MSHPTVAFLTRRETFSASHRLHSPHLTDAENKAVYGKCNHPNGHGHNYTVEVTVRGPIDQRTGMVINITTLKIVMNEVIHNRLDHKNLDKDVDYFLKVPSTTENLAVFVFNSICENLKVAELLYEVKIYETDKNSVTYRGPYSQNGALHLAQKRHNHKNCTNISSDSD